MSFSQLQIKELEKASNDFVYFTNEIFSKSSENFTGGQYVDDTARFLSQNNRTIRVSARNHFKCVPSYTPILMATGDEIKIADLSVGDFVKTQHSVNPIKEIFHTGKKKCYRLSFMGGTNIDCSEEHKILTKNGYIEAKDLKVDDKIAQVAKLDFQGHKQLSNDEIKFMAYMIAEGCLSQSRCTPTFTNYNEDIQKDFLNICNNLGFKTRLIKYGQYSVLQSMKWFRKFGLDGKNSYTKFVPYQVMSSPDYQVKLFIETLWNCDGSVHSVSKHIKKNMGLSYASSSRELLRQLKILLLRFGIHSNVSHHKSYYTGCSKIFWSGTLSINTSGSAKKFCKTFSLVEEKHVKLKKVFDIASKIKSKNFEDNIRWIRLKAKYDIGMIDCYDFSVENEHNYLINGVVVHNSYSFYDFFLYKLMFEGSTSNIEAHYFSYNADLAAYHVNKIKSAIEANPYFEYIIDAKPTAESVLKYTWDREHYTTLKPHGLVQFKRGIHANLVFVDDPFQDPDNELNPASIYKINEIFKSNILDMPHQDGGILHVAGCLDPNTIIPVKEKGLIKLSEVSVGDSIFGVDKNLKLQYRKVKNLVDNGVQGIYRVKTKNGKIINATGNHPFLMREGWVEAQKLKVKDCVACVGELKIDSDVVWEKIIEIEKIGKRQTLNLTVDGGNFVAEGIITHNTPQTNSDFFFDKNVTNRFKVRVQPAITKEGKALWSEWMNIDELEEKRIERTDRIFKREYLCLPTYSSKGFFDKEYIESKIVNSNLSSLNVSVPYKTDRRVIAGFDIGKKSHPSYLCVFEEREGKLIMIHEKWMDGWNYSNGEEYNAKFPTQLEYLKLAIKNLKIQILHYDNTRAEFESFDEQGLLPLQMVPVTFTSKSRQTMATALSRIVERRQVEIINNTRTVDQTCVVTNDLQAIASKFGHGDCYDDKTEVLTKDGWKFFKELSYDDEVATLKDHKYLEYQKPLNIINEKYIGKMYAIETTQINLVVTPRHKLLVADYGYRADNIYDLKFPHQIEGRKVMYKKDVEWKGQTQEFFMLDDIKIDMNAFLQFIGYYVSEGSTAHDKQIIIWQNLNWKSDRMYKNLKKLPFNVKRRDDKGLGDIYFFKAKLVRWCKKNLGTRSINKQLPKWVFDLSSEQLHILLDALILGDGSSMEWTTARCITYYTISPKLADQVQELALKVGWSGNIYFTDDNIGRKGVFGTGNHRVYKVSFIRHKNRPVVNKRSKSDKWIDYNGTIHCCTVPNHIIYVRRNGKPVWSGNSFWGLGLAFLGSDGLLTYSDASLGVLRREISVGGGSIFNEGAKIPKNW